MRYIQPEWSAWTGQSLEKTVGDGWQDCIHRGDRHKVAAAMKKVSYSHDPLNTTFRISMIRGHYAHVVMSGSPTFSIHSGRFIGLHGEITEADVGRSIFPDDRRPAHTPLPFIEQPHLYPAEALADHVLHARALAKSCGSDFVVNVLDMALLEIGRLLVDMDPDGPEA